MLCIIGDNKLSIICKYKVIFFICCCMVLSSCSVTGPMIARNGKVYYVNSDDCHTYNWWPDKDYIMCFDSDGNSTGNSYPMSDAAVYQYEQQQERNRKQMEDLSNRLERMNHEQMQQNNMLIQQIQTSTEHRRIMNENQRIMDKLNCMSNRFRICP